MGKAKRGGIRKKNEAETINATYVVGDQPTEADEGNLSSPTQPSSKPAEDLLEHFDDSSDPDNLDAESDNPLDEVEEEEEKEDLELELQESSEEEREETSRSSPSPPKKISKKKDNKKTKEEKADKTAIEKKANLATVMKAKGKNKKTLVAKERPPLTPKQKTTKSVDKKSMILTGIMEGLTTLDGRKGVSMPALKKFLMDNVYEGKSWEKMRPQVKRALERGLEDNLIVRPKGYEDKNGLSGNFKINKKHKSNISTSTSSSKPESEKAVSKPSKKADSSATTTENKKVAKNVLGTKMKKPPPKSESDEKAKKSKRPAKLKRSISSSDISKKRPGPKSSVKKSKSMEQLALISKKSKTKK